MPHHTYSRRRRTLLQAMPDHSIACIASGGLMARNRDSDFPFRVDSDFWYLTGFDEPDSILTLEKNSGDSRCQLFLRPKNTDEEVWTGRRLGIDRAPEQLGIDTAHNIADLDAMLGNCIQGRSVVLSLYSQKNLTEKIQKLFAENSMSRRAEECARQWHDLSLLLHQQRLYKSADEIEQMRQAAMISSLGHVQMMRTTRPERYEYQLAAVMQYECMMQGAHHQAYNPIVAGGANACILHYNENCDSLRQDDLVLIDAGCEYQYYAADITRTFPVSGRFHDWQKDLYNLVLKAQESAITACVSGNRYDSVHQAALNVLCDGLIDCGLLTQTRDQVIEEKLYRKYFMHGTSHWLGLDVHDVGNYRDGTESIQLSPGIVMTVEPGLYIPANDEHAPEQWRGTGIRIEDDIHVTENEPDVLTLATPKLPDDMQAIIGQETGRRL